ncbi:MAG: acyl carrier protein [Treponemataceae bacterium]|jgi:acyl carrier protein|nr:acyl carrier protein [Spirochaetaceae bacterium]MBO4704810.1 acyl carrier protein [Spirochaetaceae bacterium]MCR4940710.1 acyl carrier protein [Treponemataceae bacterium]
MDELFDKMKKLIADKLEVEESKITLDSSFRQDLGADSLDTYELVYAIEENLGVSVPDEKASEFETVRDAYEYIKSQQK